MKTNFTYFLLIQMFVYTSCSCQNYLISTAINNEYIDIERKSIRFFTIEYKNKEDEELLLWLDFSDEKNIDSFFVKTRGDYSLRNMIYENILHSNNMQIGSTFIKILKPFESFRFHVRLNMNYDKEKLLMYFNLHLRSTKLDNIMNKFKFNNDVFPSYSGQDVFLDNFNFPTK